LDDAKEAKDVANVHKEAKVVLRATRRPRSF
jgi:hypothetical protein